MSLRLCSEGAKKKLKGAISKLSAVSKSGAWAEMEVKRAEKQFNTLDVNRDGIIDQTDLDALDRNHDGVIDGTEFAAAFQGGKAGPSSRTQAQVPEKETTASQDTAAGEDAAAKQGEAAAAEATNHEGKAASQGQAP